MNPFPVCFPRQPDVETLTNKLLRCGSQPLPETIKNVMPWTCENGNGCVPNTSPPHPPGRSLSLGLSIISILILLFVCILTLPFLSRSDRINNVVYYIEAAL